MKGLTAKQQRIYDMRRPVEEGGRGMANGEIAAEVGISKNVVQRTLVISYKKLGISFTPRESATIAARVAASIHGTEAARPEVAAAAIDAASDPLATTQREAIDRVNAELKAAGIPGKVTDALVRRMRVRYGNAVTLKKQLSTAEILKTIDEEIYLISSYIDDKVAAESNLRDLGLVKAALLEKRQLLRGEPTQIISDGDRKSLHELLPALIAEGRRRGVTIEGAVKVINEPA